jgi:hypothetical protein
MLLHAVASNVVKAKVAGTNRDKGKKREEQSN